MRKTSTSQLMEDDPKNVRDTIRKKILTLPEILKEAIYEVREITKNRRKRVPKMHKILTAQSLKENTKISGHTNVRVNERKSKSCDVMVDEKGSYNWATHKRINL